MQKIPETKSETLTFKYFLPRMLRTFKVHYSLRGESPKTQINFNLKDKLKPLLKNVK
jgi:hypothetical protein